MDRVFTQSLAKFAAAGFGLAAVLWGASRASAHWIATLPTARDEVALLLLVVVGAVVYAALIIALFGVRWLKALVRP